MTTIAVATTTTQQHPYINKPKQTTTRTIFAKHQKITQ